MAHGSTAALLQVALICLLGTGLAQTLRRQLDVPVRMVLAHPVLRRIALSTLVFSTVKGTAQPRSAGMVSISGRWRG